jgi:hypothetical protein
MPAGVRDRAVSLRRRPSVAGVRAACRARRCLHPDCLTSSTRRAAHGRSPRAQRAARRTRAQPAHTGRRQRFAKRASSWSFRSFRGRRRGGRAAAASIVGTTMAVRHAGIRSHGHSRRRRSKRKRRSGTREDVRLPLPKSDRRPKAADGSRLAGGPGGVQAAPDGRAARRCGSAQRGGGSVTGAPRAGGARANRQA